MKVPSRVIIQGKLIVWTRYRGPFKDCSPRQHKQALTRMPGYPLPPTCTPEIGQSPNWQGSPGAADTSLLHSPVKALVIADPHHISPGCCRNLFCLPCPQASPSSKPVRVTFQIRTWSCLLLAGSNQIHPKELLYVIPRSPRIPDISTRPNSLAATPYRTYQSPCPPGDSVFSWPKICGSRNLLTGVWVSGGGEVV